MVAGGNVQEVSLGIMFGNPRFTLAVWGDIGEGWHHNVSIDHCIDLIAELEVSWPRDDVEVGVSPVEDALGRLPAVFEYVEDSTATECTGSVL